MTAPSGKFAVFRPFPGQVRVEIYPPGVDPYNGGKPNAIINFDDAAAADFLDALTEVVNDGGKR